MIECKRLDLHKVLNTLMHTHLQTYTTADDKKPENQNKKAQYLVYNTLIPNKTNCKHRITYVRSH